jgi:hypothetical protein
LLTSVLSVVLRARLTVALDRSRQLAGECARLGRQFARAPGGQQ